MIKVLVLGLHEMLGGMETYIINIVRCLNSEEINCDFLIIGKKETPVQDVLNSYYNDNKEHFFYCPSLKENFCQGYRWLRNFYANHKYDLIYLNASTAANAIYCQLAVWEKTPLITHSHRSEGQRLNHTIYRPYTRIQSKYKLACSVPAAQWMFGKREKDVVIIPNGIETERFTYNSSSREEIRRRLKINKNKIVIGHVGRFSEEKNHDFLVKLCKTLPEKYMLLCVGEGPTKENFIKSIEDEDIANRVIILPIQSDIEKYYCAMDIFVLPSYNEGLPIVLIEAQCSGLPTIIADTVTKEANISEKCYYPKLNNVEEWREIILSMDISRYDGAAFVRKSGYNMTNTAQIVKSIFYKAIKDDKQLK